MFWKKQHKQPKPLLVMPAAPDWTLEDAARWKQFLQSPTGQALWCRVRAMEAAACIKACQGEGDPKFSGGMSNAFNWLEGLATISVSPAAHGETSEDATLGEGQVPVNEELSYA